MMNFDVVKEADVWGVLDALKCMIFNITRGKLNMVSDCVFRLARRVYELFSYFMYDFKNYVLKLRKMFLLPKNVLIQNEQRLWWGTSEFLS